MPLVEISPPQISSAWRVILLTNSTTLTKVPMPDIIASFVLVFLLLFVFVLVILNIIKRIIPTTKARRLPTY